MTDVLADYEEAKKKVKMYESTWWNIALRGEQLGKTLDEEMVDRRSVQNLLDNLKMLGQQRTFCCGGWIELSHPDAHTRLKVKEDATNPRGWRITGLPVDGLLEFCAPSPYGDLKKGETVYNPSVRLASECEAAKFQFGRKSHQKSKPGDKRKTEASPQGLVDYTPQFLSVIREKVSKSLANGKDVVLQCYKLNVYGKGGFFNAHVDTPVDAAQMIGTVVVCLPCKHTGGALTVEHKGTKEEFLFANLSDDQSKIQWAAFYSDCVHEILPVEEGSRITITYNIIKQDRASFVRGSGLCQSESFSSGPMLEADNEPTLNGIASAVRMVVSDGEVFDSAFFGYFGIFLQHKYTMAALAAGNLKGCDQVLHDGLAARGLTCRPLTVLVHEVERYDTDDFFDGEPGERDVFAFSQEVVDYMNNKGPKPERVYPSWVMFVKEWSKERLLISENTREGEYCGNWTEGDEVETLYLQSALVIGFPKKSKRPGVPKQTK
ncbi:uncharacterized protein LOC119737713 [Patiria miniata]|uniref:Fe2OG dioxygenase domain-containing protein n=1 Tax=Patiria miniata TaxID=46514 RepID=A0A914AVR4_PATMI|nr:uncharacterized protein LOC119737713 [Patiria miniata]